MRGSKRLALALVLLLAAQAPALAQQQPRDSLRGTVRGPGGLPLARVRVLADEMGARRETDDRGEFSLALSPAALERGAVRLTFELDGYYPVSRQVTLPFKGKIEVRLTPLDTRGLLPDLPPTLLGKLPSYRKAEIKQVHRFLASADKRLLVLEGMVEVGSPGIVLTALKKVPAAPRWNPFWWECKPGDSLLGLAEAWGHKFNDPNLANLASQGGRERSSDGDEQRRQAVEGDALYQMLASLEKSPRVLVLNHFERWLAGGHGVEDPSLAELLAQFAAHGRGGKLVLLTDESPVLPRQIEVGWVSRLTVEGFRTDHAVNYLKTVFHVDLDRAQLADLAERYGGHPLALQLLAGGLNRLPPEQRADKVRRFLEVGTGPVDRADLEAVFQDVHDRLTPGEVLVLDLLASIHQPLGVADLLEIGRGEPGATSAEAAAALGALADRWHLIERAGGSTPEERFRPPELVRQFVEERLVADPPRNLDLQRRALAWYQQRLPPADGEKIGISEPASRVAEYDAMVAHAFAVAELASGKEREEAALAGGYAVLGLRNWHVVRGSHLLLIAQLGQCRRSLTGLPAQLARLRLAGCTLRLGGELASAGQPAEGELRCQEALALYQELGDLIGQEEAHSELGDVLTRLDHPEEAEAHYRQALALARQVRAPLEAANVQLGLGVLLIRLDRLDEAEQLLKDALGYYQKIPEPEGEANALRATGMLLERRSRLADAATAYDQALARYRELGDRAGEASTLAALGEVNRLLTQVGEAEKYFAAAAELSQRIGFRQIQANTLLSSGTLQQLQSDWKTSERSCQEALVVYRQIEDLTGQAYALRCLGDVMMRQGRLLESKKSNQDALGLFQKIADKRGEAQTLSSLGDVAISLGQAEESEDWYKKALQLYQKIQDPLGEVAVRVALADVLAATGRLDEAREHYAESLRLNRSLKPPQPLAEANALRGLGDVYVAQGQIALALEHYEKALATFTELQEKVGLLTCALGFSKAYLASDRLAESMQQLLRGVLLAVEIKLPERKPFLDIAAGLRQKTGSESFASLAQSKLEDLSEAEQKTLRQVSSEFLDLRLGKVGKSSVTPHTPAPAASPGSRRRDRRGPGGRKPPGRG